MTPEQVAIGASRRAYVETDEYNGWRGGKLATLQTRIQKARALASAAFFLEA